MRLALAALAALTLVRLALAAWLPLAPDEAYYALWAQHLQPGYYDHPPMVALWIRAGTMLCGHTALGIRLLGPISGALGTILLWDAAEQLRPKSGIIAALLLNATLMVGAGAIIMTPDTPLLFFWTAGLAALARLVASANPRWWLALGLAVGGMLLSKYTAMLFIAAVFLWLLSQAPGRAMLRSIWPWAAAGLALCLFAPDIAWNAAHDWVSYAKQGGRINGINPARSLQFLVELVAGQAGLLTPGIAVLAGLGVWRLAGDAAPTARLLLWLTLLPATVMLEHVLTDRVQSNWVAILYPSLSLAAAQLPKNLLARWLGPALTLGFGLSVLAYAQALTALLPLPPGLDTAGVQLTGWQEFTQQAMAGDPAFVTADDYATLAELAHYGPHNVMVAGFVTPDDRRWSYFAWPAAVRPGAAGVLVTRRADAPCPDLLGTVTRRRGAEVFATYRLCRFVAPNAGVATPR